MDKIRRNSGGMTLSRKSRGMILGLFAAALLAGAAGWVPAQGSGLSTVAVILMSAADDATTRALAGQATGEQLRSNDTPTTTTRALTGRATMPAPSGRIPSLSAAKGTTTSTASGAEPTSAAPDGVSTSTAAGAAAVMPAADDNTTSAAGTVAVMPAADNTTSTALGRASVLLARPPVCAVWVEAQGPDLRTSESCEALVNRLRAMGGDTMFVEARVMGDAYYKSDLAPLPPGWLDPSFNPLAEILREAHRPGAAPIRVFAVLNLLRLYNDRSAFEPPIDHLMTLHPDWVSRDYDGNERDESGNAWLDPGIPGAREHLEAVVHELVTRYPVDGVHFTGLRYPGGKMMWGYNPLALAAFRKDTGFTERKPASTAPEWEQWRADRLTELADALSRTAHEARRGVEVSASVVATGEAPGEASGEAPGEAPGAAALPDFCSALQYWPLWCVGGILDWIVLDTDSGQGAQEARFIRWVDLANTQRAGAKLMTLVSGETNASAQVERLFRIAQTRGSDGILLYSIQRPARDVAEAAKFLRYLGGTIFSRTYQMPSYAASALLASLPPLPAGSRDIQTPGKLPAPLPVSGGAWQRTPRRIQGGGELTQADAARALLGMSRAPETPSSSTLEVVPGPIDPGLLPDHAIPPPPPPVGTPRWVRVELKSGRTFVAGHVGSDNTSSFFRLKGQKAQMTLPNEQIRSITPAPAED